MVVSILKNYSLYLKSILHSYFSAHQFSPVAHTFPSIALYPLGVTEEFVFLVPYANVSDISIFIQSHIISVKVLHYIGRMICDLHHNFAGSLKVSTLQITLLRNFWFKKQETFLYHLCSSC